MFTRLKSLTTAEPTLAGDILGIVSLFVMLFAALALPSAI